MNDEQFFLANAYLDGELTADERRIAEADPAVMAEVEQLRGLQAQLRAVPPPSGAARERAISAAMTEFGAASAGAAASTATTATAATASTRPGRVRAPFWSSPAPRRYLAIAAAVVAVGALGVIVSQFGGGGDDDDFAAEPVADDAAEAPAEAALTADTILADADAADDAGGDGAADEAADEGATEMMAEVAEEAADIGSEEMDDSAGVDAAESTMEAAADEPPPFAPTPADFDPAEPVSDPLELGAFGRYLLDERAAERLGPTPNTACPADFNILGETTYVDAGESIDVYVGVLEAERTVLAIDRASCDPVLDGTLTEPTDG